jgi:flagellar biosynthesis/type III secretory pathway protein FliH
LFETGKLWDSKSGVIEDFVYPSGGDSYQRPVLDGIVEEEVEAPEPIEDIPQAQSSGTNTASEINVDQIRAEFEQRMGEESRRAFERGREQGLKEEQQAHAAALDECRQERGQQAAELLQSFLHARDTYLATVEQEVVRLSLQVAARILRRESQMDPLLLTGAVRVALGQLAATTTVRLRIPAQDEALWREAIAHLPNLEIRPEIVADPAMRLGECMVETGLGSVDLGIRAQMAEIERGFFDRAPGLAAEAAAKRTSAESQTFAEPEKMETAS